MALTSGGLTLGKHSSRKSSATHSYHQVQYFPVSKESRAVLPVPTIRCSIFLCPRNQEQRYPFLPSGAVFSCVQGIVRLPLFGVLTCTQMLMHAIAHRGCTDTVRESAPEVDSGSKIPSHIFGSNPRQYCAWLFSGTLYQLSYLRA